MYLADIDFENKELTKKFIEQYKKYVSKNNYPQIDVEFEADGHVFMIMGITNYARQLIADKEVKIVNLYNEGNDDVIDEKIIDKIFDHCAIFYVFGNYFIVTDGKYFYVNGIKLCSDKDYRELEYNDYLILESRHIANLEHIDNVIKPLRKKLCKINIDINNQYRDIHLYRGVPIVKWDCIRLDRYLITNFDNNMFSSLQLSI